MLADFLCVLFSLPLLIAGASKLASPAGLSKSLHEVLPVPLLPGLARVIGVYEIAAAVLMLITPMRRMGLVMTVVAGAGILAYTFLALRRGATESCGCFGGTTQSPIGPTNLLFGAALLGGGIWGLLVSDAPQPTEAVLVHSSILVVILTAAAMVVTLGLNRSALRTALTRGTGGR